MTASPPANGQHYAFDAPTIDLNDKAVLVTGGTGSFGRQFCRTVLERYSPGRLVVFSRDEQKQYAMQQEAPYRDRECMRFFIGDVRDVDRLEMAMRRIDYVVHAAALKIVPTAEYNPFECIHTNVYGAENVVKASIRAGVKRVVALSTDKAVNPINLYGASKLAADKIFVSAHMMSGGVAPIFAVVRYGNVVGSRGSVVPFFQRLLKEGADSLPITDMRMTRFWITLEQGVDFVLSSLALMRGQEIFVPKIPTMKITDLARALAPDVRMHEVGIRPGEKIHEALITEEDARNTLDLGDRYMICPGSEPRLRRQYIDAGAVPVGEDFHYTSDLNQDWMDDRRLHAMLAPGVT